MKKTVYELIKEETQEVMLTTNNEVGCDFLRDIFRRYGIKCWTRIHPLENIPDDILRMKRKAFKCECISVLDIVK